MLAGRTFPAFPYVPYQIQTAFMQNVYRTIEIGGIGLFESPTGGKKDFIFRDVPDRVLLYVTDRQQNT